MIKWIKELNRSFTGSIDNYIKYQIITKLIQSVVATPILLWIIQRLITSRGNVAISNGMLFKFLLSPQGFAFVLIVISLIMLGTVVEIFGFVTISARSIHNRPECSYFTLVISNIKKIPKLLNSGGLIIMLYLIVLVPLSGIGITLSFLKSVRIPNFITSVIDGSDSYFAMYAALILVFAILVVRWIFTFQFIIIGGQSASKAMKASGRLVRKNFRSLLYRFVLVNLIYIAIIGLIVAIWAAFIIFLSLHININTTIGRIQMVSIMVFQSVITTIWRLLTIPFEVNLLNKLFYDYAGRDEEYAHLVDAYPYVKEKKKLSMLDKIFARKKTVIFVGLILVILYAIPNGILFNEIYIRNHKIEVISHRAGGDNQPENTIDGLEYAIKVKADWTEIDVQRTKDGKYILNHDDTFKRLSGVNLKSTDMTLEEIKKLVVTNKYFPEQKAKVPTLDEYMDKSKDKIGIFIELKGATADQKMADDVVKMIRDKKMQDQTVVIGLDYKLISYVEDKYKDINTGFLYFLAFGNVQKLKGDYMVIEEDAATDLTIAKLKEAGKKVVVWTVNDDDGIDKFSDKAIDGMITDIPKILRERLDIKVNRSSEDTFMDFIFKPFGLN